MTTLLYRLIIPAAALAALASGCSRQPAQAPRVPPPPKPVADAVLAPSFTHAQSGLKFDAPEGWGFVAKPGYALAECRPKQAESDLPVILVQASPAAADLSMEAIVSGYSRQIARGIETPKIILDQSVTTAFEDAQAYQIAYTGTLAGSAVTGSPVLIRKGGWLVVVTLLCAQNDYEDLKQPLARFARLREPQKPE